MTSPTAAAVALLTVTVALSVHFSDGAPRPVGGDHRGSEHGDGVRPAEHRGDNGQAQGKDDRLAYFLARMKIQSREWFNERHHRRLTPAQHTYFHDNCSAVNKHGKFRPRAGPSIANRRECRTVDRRSLDRLFAAIGRLMASRIGTLTRYQTIASEHQSGSSPAAHFGCGFLGWHRHYLYT